MEMLGATLTPPVSTCQEAIAVTVILATLHGAECAWVSHDFITLVVL